MNIPPITFADLGGLHAEQAAELTEAAARVLAKGHYVLGPEVEAFEREWAAWCEAPLAVGVVNGLEALVLGLQACGVGPGDEVIVPANTYIATFLAVSQVGAKPVPVEPVEGTCNLDPALVAAAITPRTRALMPVHLYGLPADMTPLLALAKQHGLRVVEDAAQCHGARYHGRRIGSHGDIVAWSFYPTKNLGAAGEAGAITTSNQALADDVRMRRNYGSKQRYVCEVTGRNSRLDELQAALLRVKLRRLDAWNARRAVLAARYEPVVRAAGLQRQEISPGCESVHHLFTVRSPHRAQLQSHLQSAGVPTIVHYPIPPHLQGAYRELGFGRGNFPITERIHDTILSLPLHPTLSDDQQDVALRALATWKAPC
jgi:dTDP-4-amino-4,6-dideoxygalactose transaminase